jgi:tetratricopeptide (TPR) repeat protein
MMAAYTAFLVSRQQTPKARAIAQQFVDANPNNAPAHVILGALKYDAKNPSAAQAEFERAIQIDPRNILGYLQLGGLYRQESQTAAALGEYQKALELQPKSAPLITLVGNVYLEKDDLETARKYFTRALEADPNFPAANANLAWVDAQEGKDLDVALGLAQKAKSLNPDDSAISDVLGWVMYKKGNYTGAIPLHRDCVRKRPDSAQYRYHLGLDLIAAGQREPGSEQLQAALQMNNLRAADRELAKQALRQTN